MGKRLIIIVSSIFLAIALALGITLYFNANNEEVETLPEYQVTWVVDGAVYEETYLLGEMPTFKFGVSKPSENGVEYSFVGWDKSLKVVTENVIYIAQYVKNLYDYIYTWNIDGKLTYETYKYGDTPYYKGEVPTKVGDESGDYEFIGWDKELDLVEEDLEVTALFKHNIKSYEISFDVEGQITKESWYYGSIPEYGLVPTKDATEDCFYEFVGWKDLTTDIVYEDVLPNVKNDTAYKAVFDSVEKWNGIKLNLINIDGSLIESKVLEYVVGDIYNITAPTVDGLVPQTDYVSGIVKGNQVVNIYYSTINKWDGSAISDKLEGEGTLSNPYLIKSAADFAYFNNQVNGGNNYKGKYIKLVSSIDLDNIKNFIFTEFAGILDGNNCTVKGIYISGTADTNALFRSLLKGGKIQNLSIFGSVKGAKYTAGLVGISQGQITNCSNYATITGTGGNIGGITGYAYNEVLGLVNCQNYGAVNGQSWNNGGIAGFAETNVSDCLNFGEVSSTIDCVAGIAGTSNKTIKNCINFGDLSGQARVAGIVYDSNNDVINCKNYGNITGQWDNGGIVSLAKGMVINCENYGTVNGTSQIGGIVGMTSNVVVGCKNYGNVESSSYVVGGIAGNSIKLIDDCINEGNITGKGNIGGIAGNAINEVINCTNIGDVSGTVDIMGGIVGLNPLANNNFQSLIIENCINEGNVSGKKSGGIIGKSYDAVIKVCTNKGVITGAGVIGGIAGEASGEILECINEGKIDSTGQFNGGLVGDNPLYNSIGRKLSIISSTNKGSVIGKAKTGGLVGQIYHGMILDSVNEGNVSGTNTTAGIAAALSWSNASEILIDGCVNKGEVVGTSYFVSGLVGTANLALITNCVNDGAVTTTGDCAGGIAGVVYNTSIVEGCINNGDITGKTKLGGIANENRGLITNCKNTGKIVPTNNNGTSGYIADTNTGKIIDCYNNETLI